MPVAGTEEQVEDLVRMTNRRFEDVPERDCVEQLKQQNKCGPT
jgi:hypothetical protein